MFRLNEGCSVWGSVLLQGAGPRVGGGVVFPLSVSVGLALQLLLSDVFVSVSGVLGHGGGLGGGNSEGCEDE